MEQLLRSEGDMDRAQAMYQQALAILRAGGGDTRTPLLLADVLNNIGGVSDVAWQASHRTPRRCTAPRDDCQTHWKPTKKP